MLTAGSLDTAPDLFEPFHAWRVWRVTKESRVVALASVANAVIWPAEEPLAAECRRRHSRLALLLRRGAIHAAPAMHCVCGIYATDLDHALDYLTNDAFPFQMATVLGRVALWGEVVECERGYRASYAYPVTLFVPEAEQAGEVALGLERYGVPVEMLPSGQSVAESAVRLSA